MSGVILPGPGLVLPGGGASLPTADVSDLLAGATPNTFVVVDPVGNSALATFAAARAALAAGATYDGSSSSGWTATAGSGTAAVTGGVFRLTMPALTNSGDGGRASIVRDHTSDVPADAFRARVRLAALTNGNGDTFVGFYLYSSTTSNELRLSVHPNGSAECGYVGASWSGVLATLAAGTVAFDGTWWLEIVVRGLHVALRVGQGTSSTPPAESSTTWRWLYSADLFSRWNGGRPWDRLGLFLTTYGTGGGAITMDFDDLVLERLTL